MNNISIINTNNETNFIAEILKAEQGRLIDPSYLEKLKLPYSIRVAYYLRVSTLLQAGKNKVSIPEQEIQINEYITKRNWIIYDRYSDEGISGKSMEARDDFSRMITDAKLGKFDVIIAWTTDRLARNVDEMTALRAEIRKYNVQITTVKEPADIVDPRTFSTEQNREFKKMMAYLQDWNAEQDNVKRVLRFEAGKLGKARKGKIPVKVPYGYRKVVYFENGDPKKKIETDIVVENHAIVVKEIFFLYDKRSWGMKKIAEHLTIKGYPSPRGGMWCYSTIKYTLQNPTYTGLVRFGWKLSKSKESRARLQQGHQGIINRGEHQKIIDPEQYKRVQEKMAIRKKLGGKAVSSRGLLTGILKCGRCGGGTFLKTFPNWYSYTKKLEDRAKYKPAKTYACSKYQNYGKSVCSKSWVIYAEKVEKIVIEKITNLANSEEARQEFAKQMKKNNAKEFKTKLRILDNTFTEFEGKRKRLKQVYINGISKIDEYTKDREALDVEQAQLAKKIEETKIALLKEERVAQQSEIALSALADFDKSWSTTEFTEKKALLQTLLEKVVVKDNDIQIYFAQNS